MIDHVSLTWIVPALLLFAGLVPCAQAQDLNVHLISSSDIVEPGGLLTYTLVAANKGAGTLENVQADVRLPNQINGFYTATTLGEGITCSGGFCNPDETATWTVGTLSPGQSRLVIFQTYVDDGAPKGTLTSQVAASADDLSDISFSHEVAVDPGLLLRLSVAPGQGPAVAGEPFTYTLSFGNVGSTSPSGVVLSMPLPEGTSFVSATGGGTESDGTVTWDIGTLGVGASGHVRLTVLPTDSPEPAAMLTATAAIDPGTATSPVTRASAITPLGAREPLHIAFSVSQSSVEPDGLLLVTLTASNEGTTELTDVAVSVLMPTWITGFYTATTLGEGITCSGGFCNPDETATWTVGTLSPGQSYSVTFTTSLSDEAPQGEVLRSILMARSSETTQITAAQDLRVDPSPLLRLSLVADRNPAVAGEPFTYTLSFGNVGSTSPSGVVLSMPLPEGTSFVSATGGGTESDGTVTWDIGTLGVGASGHVRVVVLPEATLSSGALLKARAALDSGLATEHVVRSTTVVPVGNDVPLRMAYSVSQTTAVRGNRLLFTLTASNESTADLTDVAADVLLPAWIDGFYTTSVVGTGITCSGGFCNANETATWNVGTLSPGQSRTAFFLTSAQDDAPQGEILRSGVMASSSSTWPLRLTQDLTVDPTPLLRLSLAPGPGPAVAGEPFTYTITFGNIGTTNPSDVVLRMDVPDGTSFASTTPEGVGVERDGTVTWDVGQLAEEYGGQVQLTVNVYPGLSDGAILNAQAELDSGVNTEVIVRATAATPVRAAGPLLVTYAIDQEAVMPGGELTFTLEAANESAADLTDVAADVLLPAWIDGFYTTSVVGTGITCSGGFCNANETATWNVGTLAPEQSRTVLFTSTVSDDAPLGTVLRSPVVATATGSNEVILRRDLLVGTLIEFDHSPTAAVITSPEDASTLFIELGENDEPIRPDSIFVVEWNASIDPQNDPLTYTWQLSDAEDFSNLLIDEPSADDGTATHYETDFGALNDAIGRGAFTLYHRVLTSDGVNEVSSTTRTLSLDIGTPVDVGHAPDLPHAFALHGNYPNPFNPTTTFSFDLPEPAQATLTVYDLIGREVAMVVSTRLPAGTFRYEWDAGSLPSGVYFYRLQAGSFSQTRTLILLK